MWDDVQRAAAEAAGVAIEPRVRPLFPSPSPGVLELMSGWAGTSFGGGAYRLLRLDEVDAHVERCVALVPEAEGRIRCFGTDWLGRSWGYYVDEPRVAVVEPYSAELLSAPFTVLEWHAAEIPDGILEDELWDFWVARNPVPAEDQCVGLKVPMFLGGDLEPDNLSLSDRDVYWEICTQLRRQMADLPAGTSIDSVRLEG